MGEISIWDDPEGFVAEIANSPDAQRVRQQTATRRRGGLRQVCGKAVEKRFGVTFNAFEDQARSSKPRRETVRAAHDALRAVAGLDPDHAREANGRGFDKSDVALGHALASASAESIASSPAHAALVIQLAGKYRRQVAPRLCLALGLTDQTDMFDSRHGVESGSGIRRRAARGLPEVEGLADVARVSGMAGPTARTVPRRGGIGCRRPLADPR